ncbi:MAG: aminotransferase class III-fold pyridoxal phosphate-dependent enzyme, partial [Proteobacteria bacterium]|nr:aminotransferase class III-fold pyridoxal phosphate-dependent enzyme [Pseudomonadota bacterium]
MLLNTYKRLPVSFARGQGCSLFDSSGQAYLDAVSGVAVCNLGHAHPAITETIAKQASRLMHVSNLVCIPEQEKLADELLGFAGLHSAFFSNSGSEANETA